MRTAQQVIKEMLLTTVVGFALASLAAFMWTAALRGRGTVDVYAAAAIGVALGIAVPLVRWLRARRRDGGFSGRESSSRR